MPEYQCPPEYWAMPVNIRHMRPDWYWYDNTGAENARQAMVNAAHDEALLLMEWEWPEHLTASATNRWQLAILT